MMVFHPVICNGAFRVLCWVSSTTTSNRTLVIYIIELVPELSGHCSPVVVVRALMWLVVRVVGLNPIGSSSFPVNITMI